MLLIFQGVEDDITNYHNRHNSPCKETTMGHKLTTVDHNWL